MRYQDCVLDCETLGEIRRVDRLVAAQNKVSTRMQAAIDRYLESDAEVLRFHFKKMPLALLSFFWIELFEINDALQRDLDTIKAKSAEQVERLCLPESRNLVAIARKNRRFFRLQNVVIELLLEEPPNKLALELCIQEGFDEEHPVNKSSAWLFKITSINVIHAPGVTDIRYRLEDSPVKVQFYNSYAAFCQGAATLPSVTFSTPSHASSSAPFFTAPNFATPPTTPIANFRLQGVKASTV